MEYLAQDSLKLPVLWPQPPLEGPAVCRHPWAGFFSRQNDETSAPMLLSEASLTFPPHKSGAGALCPSRLCLDSPLLLTSLCLFGPWCPRWGVLASLRPPGRVLGCHQKAEEWGLVSEVPHDQDRKCPKGCGICKHVGGITPVTRLCLGCGLKSYRMGRGSATTLCSQVVGIDGNRKHGATVCFFHRTPGTRCLLWWRRWFS